jgi:ADP-ribose pyrophosphatase
MTGSYRVLRSRRVFEGGVIAVRSDEISMPGGGSGTRDVVEHPGAVGIVALDDQERVVLVRQYRHPVGRPLWELPAGLLDVAGEPALQAAARELREETGLRADRWDVLVDALSSPGMTDEAYRIYLARGLHDGERPVGADEEAEIVVARVPLQDAVGQVMRGDIRNAMACLGLLATEWGRRSEFTELRPADARWADRPPLGGDSR